MDAAAKCRAILGATLAAGPWDFVLWLPHLSDGSVASVGFRGTLALSSQDGKRTEEKTGGLGDLCSWREIKDPTLSMKQREVFISALVNEGILIYNC